MDRPRIPVHASFISLALLLVLAGGCLPGWQTDEPPVANDQTDKLTGTPNASGCVDFGGFTNCPLGDARLLPSEDGTTLDVTSLRTAGEDGVSFLLPEVTDFEVTGSRPPSSSSTMISRAISDGDVTSTMTVRDTDDGFTVSGTFTGNDASTYNAELYRAGELVGTVAGLASGGEGLRARWLQRPIIIWVIQIGFHIYIFIFGAQQAEATEGACIWDLALPKNQQASTTLADGTEVTFDHVRLVENVEPSGSYPYLTFDRIDYTSDDGTFRISNERAQ